VWELVLKASKALPISSAAIPASPCKDKLQHGSDKTPPPSLPVMLKPSCLTRDGAPQAQSQIGLEHRLIKTSGNLSGGERRADTVYLGSVVSKHFIATSKFIDL